MVDVPYGFDVSSPGGSSTSSGRGFRRYRSEPKSFLDDFLKGTSTSRPILLASQEDSDTSSQSSAPEQTSSQGGSTGFGLTPEGKPIVDSYGSFAGFMPKIEKRDGKFYVEDNRGYGSFKGKTHEVPESMAKMQARKASMGMTRFLMPNPNPEQFAQTTAAGGITGSMMPEYVTGGGTIHNPQFSFSGALTPKSYNELATAFQTQQNPNFDPMSKDGSEIVTSNYDISANPGLALRMGMPINRMAVAEDIARRRGTGIDESVLRRADWRIGSQLYRKNVAGGFAEPGTYARQGGGIPKGSTWGQVSRGR